MVNLTICFVFKYFFENKNQREGQDTVEALLYLARYAKDQGKMQDAEGYCLRLLDYAGKVTHQ